MNTPRLTAQTTGVTGPCAVLLSDLRDLAAFARSSTDPELVDRLCMELATAHADSMRRTISSHSGIVCTAASAQQTIERGAIQ